MGTICAEQHPKLLPPPRKLLLPRPLETPDHYTFSPKSTTCLSLLHRFLPSSADSDGVQPPSAAAAAAEINSGGNGGGGPYSSDHFRMFEFKVRRCSRSRSHDWTDCPFAHPGEKARRRDPRRFGYSAAPCPEFRRAGTCPRGDACDLAHGVFEAYLHPSRYRTEPCKDGGHCRRKVCFFAHTPQQLRFIPPFSSSSNPNPNTNPACAFHNCCSFCRSSPTSTLAGMSNFSPPASPPQSPATPGSFGGRFSPERAVGYGDALAELLDAINLGDATFPSPVSGNFDCKKMEWVNDFWFDGEDQKQQQEQMIGGGGSRRGSRFVGRDFEQERCSRKCLSEDEIGEGDLGCPDLEWVNDLLM